MSIDLFMLFQVMVPITDLSRPTTLDFHAAKNQIYFADSQTYKIERASVLGETVTREDFLATGLNKVEGVAVDWVGNNLFWTDEGLQAIYVASLEDSARKRLLLSGNMSHPRSIAVEPSPGRIYWTNSSCWTMK